MNIIFKMFGAPYVFDLYDAKDKSEVEYFQTFDHKSNVKVKLIIHRQMDGKVSYSYLRYDFISSSGRPNAFLGMSVIFDNEYCADIESLYNLFDFAFNKIIEKKNICSEDCDQNGKQIYRYKVKQLNEAKEEVESIGRDIIKNINKHFAEDIHPLHSNQQPQEKTKTVRIGLGEEGEANQAFKEAFSRYAWITISPEYNPDKAPEVVLSPEIIHQLEKQLKSVEKNRGDLAISALKKEDVKSRVLENIAALEKSQTLIKKYLTYHPELKEIQDGGKDEIEKLNAILQSLGTGIYTNTNTSTGTNTGTNTSTGLSANLTLFWQRYRVQLIAMATVFLLLIIGGALYLLRPKAPTLVPPTSYDTPDQIAKGDSCFAITPISIANIDQAISFYQQSKNNKDKKDKIEAAKTEAIKLFISEATKKYNAKKGKGIEKYRNAKSILDSAATKYGENQAIKNKIKEISDSTIAYYEEHYRKNTNGRKKEYKGYITEVDSTYVAYELVDNKSNSGNKPPSTVTTPEVTIQASKTKDVKIGEQITLTATINNKVVVSGKWQFKNSNIKISDLDDNPATVEFLKAGEYDIKYTIDDEPKSTGTIKVTNQVE